MNGETTDDPTSSTNDNNDIVNVARENATAPSAQTLTEAPAAFDGLSNGFIDPADTQEMQDVTTGFTNQEQKADGLGPVYNAQSCGECHQTPITGGGSQISELRAGHFNGTNFIDAPGGSLINDRAVDASIQERVPDADEVRTFRLTTNILGDAFIEAVDSNIIANNAANQPPAQRGTFIQVPVFEATGNTIGAPAACANNTPLCRGGRFGWKDQQASLVSFAADAYVNEMGITSKFQPTENTSMGKSVAAFDVKADPEDPDDADVDEFVSFMRASKAPPRDTALAATSDAQAGANLFNSVGCATCHITTFSTVTAGTVINGGAYTVPPAIGDKTFHPYSDFLLHDVGTGDGIVQNGGQATRNKLRTPPLWGLRARSRLMHDAATVTRTDAIARHKNQGATAASNFANLSTTQKGQLLTFLDSL